MAAMCAAWAATPRNAPEDYPLHGESADSAIGAEYLVHSLPTENGMLLAGRYLVVEVGIFPHKHTEVSVSPGEFHLIANGRMLPDADSAGMVAASMKYSDWEGQRGIQAVGGAGPIVIGPQQPAGRFPGDPNAPPPVEHPPASDDPAVGPPQALTIDELVLHAALPSAAVRTPIDGCVFFH